MQTSTYSKIIYKTLLPMDDMDGTSKILPSIPWLSLQLQMWRHLKKIVVYVEGTLHTWISLLEIASDIMPTPFRVGGKLCQLILRGVRILPLLTSRHKNPPYIHLAMSDYWCIYEDWEIMGLIYDKIVMNWSRATYKRTVILSPTSYIDCLQQLASVGWVQCFFEEFLCRIKP